MAVKQSRKARSVPLLIISTSPFLVILTIALSVLYGTKGIDAATIWQAIIHFDSTDVDHNIIMQSRLPRVLAALLVGAFLAISGAIMQGMTRNYLASPSIMGVTDGSAFAITICMIFFPAMSNIEMIIFSMIGSAVGAGIVFGFGSIMRNGLSPVRLAIIGTVIGTFLSSLSSVLATHFQVSQDLAFWYNAKIHKVDPDILLLALPIGLIGLVLALFISKSITILSLGEDISISLGQRTKWVKALSIIIVICLTGTAVALVGKIGFVGLIIPHITRFLVGIDYRFVIPCSAIIGGVFLALCDVASRFINFPFETPVGVFTALIGVPFFLYLIKTRGGERRA